MQAGFSSVQFISVTQSCPTLCYPMDCSTPGFPVHHHSQRLLKFMSIESVMPSSHLILCRPLLLPSIFEKIEEKIKEEKPLQRSVKLWRDDKQIQNSCHVKDTKLKTCTLPVLPLLSPKKMWDRRTLLFFKVSCIHFSVNSHSIQLNNKKISLNKMKFISIKLKEIEIWQVQAGMEVILVSSGTQAPFFLLQLSKPGHGPRLLPKLQSSHLHFDQQKGR